MQKKQNTHLTLQIRLKYLLTNISKSNIFFGGNHHYQYEVYLSSSLAMQLYAYIYRWKNVFYVAGIF